MLFLPGLNSLAVPAAPFPSRTGVIALPAASVDLELGEEHIARASVRLSRLLDWNAPSEALCGAFFIELLEERWVGVRSVLAAPQGATGFHVDGRMPYGPDLLAHVTSDGRYGELKSGWSADS